PIPATKSAIVVPYDRPRRMIGLEKAPPSLCRASRVPSAAFPRIGARPGKRLELLDGLLGRAPQHRLLLLGHGPGHRIDHAQRADGVPPPREKRRPGIEADPVLEQE